MKIIFIFLSVFVFFINFSSAQVKISSSSGNPDSSAGLEVDFSNKGFLPPRMNTTQRNAIQSPAVGLMILNTDNYCMEYYRPSGWYSMCPRLATVSTSSVTSVTGVSAVSGGQITDDGGATVITRGICWSTSPSPTVSDFIESNSGIGIGNFVSSITGLQNGTTYYVRAYATNSVGTAYGNEISFTTLDKPTVQTSVATLIYGKNVTSGGTILSDGGASILTKGICWSTNPNPTLSNSYLSLGSGSANFSTVISGLNYSTTYYARAYATNSVGTSFGNQIVFSTTGGVLEVFTNVGAFSWTPPNGVSSAEVLVVAGGGGGGAFGGGGGGGGLIYKSSYSFSQATITIEVGGGGLGSSAYNIANSPGANGGNSRFDSLLAFGGGGGGTRGPFPHPGFSGTNGGSGGGASPADQNFLAAGGDADFIEPRQGYDGGSQIAYGWGGSGGGGAGGPGGNANGNIGGNGGPGLSFSITGTPIYYSGGGGGCSYNSNPVGQGGIGGGGSGVLTGNGNSGAVNTGGGGGGSGVASTGGTGGAGIVIVKY
jgi:hypothetical protein